MPCKIQTKIDHFPLKEPFVISRGTRTEAIVVTVELTDLNNQKIGRGECTPYARYGESVDSVIAQIENIRPSVENGISHEALSRIIPAGAARNAIDNALWDLEAKVTGIPAHITAGAKDWAPVTTAFTISIGTPEVMNKSAVKAADRPLLKVKLGGGDNLDIERIKAVRSGAPNATLIADANEGWTENNLPEHFLACSDAGYAMIEQPLPAELDHILKTIDKPVPLCADESAHRREALPTLVGIYDLVNIKLDKTGGLYEALSVANEVQQLGMDIMVGCMLGSSLAMAPAMILASKAKYVDLDGPLLLSADRTPPLHCEQSLLYPPTPELWG
ncbi:N-acetyl-D-Glu racemase DgcA [Hohaiivirga grylli]|uniref:N-acetyl-D-Glu racemase DgcA n=1 Tax=Hohaiivirga grylli TaxID=3133970 RepID=UPI00387E738B